MISVVGSLCLYFALMTSILQCLLPLYGYYRNNPYALSSARVLALATASFMILSYVLLTIAFATSDFSIAYVAMHSHPTLPLMYRLTALWGAHEGSMLLWIVVLQVWSLFYILLRSSHTLLPLVLATLGGVSAAFLCFLLLTSNPFLAATTALSGQDLNPLLQDLGFIFHPPFLFMGYVGFSVSFALALSTLLQRDSDDTFLIVRQFALAAWCFLTIGILLGAWWAYRVLGWGGFWFWDPVENASLLPWMTGIALIHVLLLVKHRPALKSFALLLAMMTFALSLLGTFLVRSGVLISVHTFASDPSRGVALLLILGCLVTVGLGVYLWRFPTLIIKQDVMGALFSRENAVFFGSLLWLVAMLTVLLGTLYPLILDVLHQGMLSVGAPYFNSVLLPVIALLLAVMSVVIAIRNPEQSFWAMSKPLLALASLLFAVSLIGLYYLTHTVLYWHALLLSLSITVLLTHLNVYRYLLPTTLAHSGFAILLIGILLSSVMSVEKEAQLKHGGSVMLGPYQFTLLNTEAVLGSNYRGIKATLQVTKQQYQVATLFPEKRIYAVRDMVMTKVDIHPGIFRDLYVALGEPLDQETWSLRLYYKPFIRWILAGALMMALGGALAFLRLQRR